MINKIHNCKWEDGIEKLEDNSVDCIITSPPYNVKLGKNKKKKDAYEEYEDNMPYTEYLEWMDELWADSFRVLKEGGRICVNIGDGANGSVPTHADFIVRMMNIGFTMVTTIIWHKDQVGNRTSWGSWQSPSKPSFPTPYEFILVLQKGEGRHEGDKEKITVSRDDFIRNSLSLWKILPETGMMKKYGHPAMFPEEIPRRLMDQLTYAGDVVLDPFSGAGTTCAVAKKMGRNYIGFELTEKYVDVSRKRLEDIPSVTDSGEIEWIAS